MLFKNQNVSSYNCKQNMLCTIIIRMNKKNNLLFKIQKYQNIIENMLSLVSKVSTGNI